ncbi:MAG: hypothetical protein LBH25_13385 [Fibromonadaceae bacterium]|jgi:hypothetical protein|nr:hypothetical protein [Fibromonadaceae bacterium]
MPYNYNNDIINKILPVNCESYLKNKGWSETGRLGNVARLFGKVNDEGKFFEVLVPTKTDIGDFKSVILKLLFALQDFENRSLDYIANDIVLSKFDVLRVIAFKGDTSTDLPLEAAKTLLDRSFAMMASAAQSIITQQPYFSQRRGEVNEFMSKLRMGHTERGSFIVTLQTPIAPIIPEPSLLFDVEPLITKEPFGRQVTVRLCSLISEANTIANEPESDALTQSIARGMSANFFEALADITEVCGDAGTNLDMTWAAVRPIQPAWNIKDKFIVEKEKVETLREAGRTLRTRVPETDVEVTGYVIALHRDENADKGIIKLNDVISRPMRVISAELDLKRYNQAIKAHENRDIVVMKGDLQKGGRGCSLTDISEFKVVDITEIS